MSATRLLLLGLCVLIPLQTGCATRTLWKAGPEYGSWHEPPPTCAYSLAEAVRTGDGALHLRVRTSDGSIRHFVIDGGPVLVGAQDARASGSRRTHPTDGAGQWPSAGEERGASLPAPRQAFTDLPGGLPLDVVGVPPAAPPDAAVATLVGGDSAASARPRVRLEGRRVLVAESDEAQLVAVAEFPPPRPGPPPPAPRRTTPAEAAATLVLATTKLALTPVALAADAVLGATWVVRLVILFPFLGYWS